MQNRFMPVSRITHRIILDPSQELHGTDGLADVRLACGKVPMKSKKFTGFPR